MISNFLFDLFFDWVPWWAWVAVAAAGLFTAWRFLGTKATIALGAAAAVAIASIRGVQIGRDVERDRQKQKVQKSVERRKRIDTDVEQMTEADIRNELRKYERKP